MMALLLAAGLGLLEWQVVRGNVGAQWNGFGAIPGVLRRDSGAPMRYRVLVPWVLAGLWSSKSKGIAGLWSGESTGRGRVVMYQVVKVGLLAAALGVWEGLLGRAGVLALALAVALTLEFDYWDCYAELLGMGLALTGSPGWVAVGAVVWGLSRETAGLAPVLGYVAGGFWAGLAGLLGPAVLGAVRVVQGPARLYCERWTWRAYNVGDLKAAWGRLDPGPLLSLGWTVATVAAVVWGRGEMGEELARSAPAALIWLVAGWTMARARETRVFLPCAVWVVGWLVPPP